MRTATLKIALTLVVLLSGLTMSARVFRSVYRGTIAGQNVRVELNVDDNNYSVRGSYTYYDKRGRKLSSRLNLKGQCRPIGPTRNYYELTETTPSGQYCGSWDANFNCETGRMTGTMINAKGKRFNINLREVE